MAMIAIITPPTLPPTSSFIGHLTPAVTDSLDRLRSTAASGSLRETKMRYIEAVEKLESWARDSGSVKTLKGF